MVQKIYSKIHTVLRTNTHHDVTDSVNHGMGKNTCFFIVSNQVAKGLRLKMA